MPPAFSPTDITRRVLDVADRDGDGECTLEELKLVPGLNRFVADLDTDKNGILSEAEIFNWLAAGRNSRVAAYPASVCILQRGAPLPGVRVQIVPEPCMGNTIQAAEGTTDNAGIAALRMPILPFGAHFGIYRIKITGKGTSGQRIATQYNSESSLGLIVPLIGRLPRFDLE